MKRDRVGSASDEELGRLLRGAIERSGEQGVGLLVFGASVRATIGVPALYDHNHESIPGEEMHEFANVSNALVSLNHAPRRSVEVRGWASVPAADWERALDKALEAHRHTEAKGH